MKINLWTVVTVSTILINVTVAFKSSWKDIMFLKFHYRPQRRWGKVMFLQVSVILLTGRCLVQGGCLLPGGLLPRGLVWGVSAPVGVGLFLGGCLLRGVPGGDPTPLGWPLLWAVHILLECILVYILNFAAKAIYNGLKYPRTIC